MQHAAHKSRNTKTKTYVIDVSDLRKPKWLKTFVGPVAAIDHNLYIKGDLAFASNYASGLRIDDTSALNSGGTLREVGYFDTFPSKNEATFDGVWSSYIYLPSGNLLISSIEYGLFVVKVTGDLAGAPTPSPSAAPVEPVQCRSVTDKTECTAAKQTSKCRWGVPPGEDTERCYAPCTQTPLKRKKQCAKAAPLSCRWSKVAGIKRKKCSEIPE